MKRRPVYRGSRGSSSAAGGLPGPRVRKQYVKPMLQKTRGK